MPYIPRKVVPGKHYAIYTEAKKAKVKTKAAVLKEALDIALEKAEHAEWIDFIPAKFTLQCFDKETEILTDSGWKKFYELAKEDKVAQIRNVKGFTLEFVKPLKIWTQDYEGEMIGIRNDYIDVLVNPEHRFFVKNGTIGRGWQFRTAKACFGKKIRLNPGSVRWDGLFCGHPRWFELLGFFFADGSYQLKGKGKSNNYSLTFTQRNKKEYLENLLSELGLKIQKTSREPEGTILFKIDNKGLGLFFSQFGKRERKHIPSFIRNASPELLRSFLIGYSNGDGYRREGDWRFRGSKQIIDALQEIAIKAGFPARILVEKAGKGSFSNKLKHILSISKESIKFVTVNPQDWYKVNYKDRIYSVKVPSGVILIRRNGKPSLQGNCHGWFKEDPKEGYTNLKQIQDAIKSALKSGKDPIKELKGKWHYDLRIQKATAPTWFGLCVDENTEVLTQEEGWKYFKDLRGDEFVGVLSPKKELVFERPKALVKRPWNGSMISVKSSNIDMLVTPDHLCSFDKSCKENFRMWPAIEIYQFNGTFSRKVVWKGKSQRILGKKITPEFAELLGFWFAEGSLNGNFVVLTQVTHIDYLKDLLKKNNINWKMWGRKEFVWKDKNLVKYLSKYSKALTKFIPPEIKNEKPEILKAFINGFSKGDGFKREKKDWRLFTSSRKLADDLQEICMKAGYVSNIRIPKPQQNSFSQKRKYRIALCLTSKKEKAYVSKRNWGLVDYSGYVYDVVMPGNTQVLIRRNGIYHWTYRTPFSAPWKATPEQKAMGSIKGYQSIAPGGKKLQEFLLKRAEKEMATEGISERRDRLEWMKIKAQWFPIDSPGNPQKFEPAAMIAIEFFKPACLHRRTLRFVDITFFGDYLKGRYFNRLVERKLNKDELMEWQKEAIKKGQAKEFYQLNFYFWKAKEQWGQPGTKYSMKDVYQAALGKKTLDPLPAPPSKDVEEKEKEKTKTKKKVKPPLATKVFH